MWILYIFYVDLDILDCVSNVIRKNKSFDDLRKY